MDTLQTVVKLNGVGQSIEATLIERKKNVCIYEREDNVYEVFIVKVSPASKIFDVDYPEREVYPNNEDFGKSAWCYKNRESAMKKFEQLTKKRK